MQGSTHRELLTLRLEFENDHPSIRHNSPDDSQALFGRCGTIIPRCKVLLEQTLCHVEPEQVLRIEVKKGPMEGRVFNFEGHDVFLFGRDENHCHAYSNDDPYVSRHHFLIELNSPLARLHDLGSRNGTFVNGGRVGGNARKAPSEKGGKERWAEENISDLNDRDVIMAGQSVFQIIREERKITETMTFDQYPPEAEEPPSQNMNRQTIVELPPEAKQALAGRQTITETESLLKKAPAGDAGRATMVENGNGSFQEILDRAGQTKKDEVPIIDGYQLKEKIASGRFGDTYTAVRNIDESIVTIKFLHSSLPVKQADRDEFRNEVSGITRIRHRNITQCFGSGCIGNYFYFVSEFCDSGTLHELFRKRRESVKLKHVVRALYLLLDAMGLAHEKGLVHRDLQPSNILVAKRSEQWLPKLANFGVTKAFEKGPYAGLSISETDRSEMRFIPREQITDYRSMNPASDVFSLAACFYYMITGKPPRPEDNSTDPLSAILSTEITPIHHRVPRLHSGVAAVIDKALLDDCNQRFANGREMQLALHSVMKKEGWA